MSSVKRCYSTLGPAGLTITIAALLLVSCSKKEAPPPSQGFALGFVASCGAGVPSMRSTTGAFHEPVSL